ncbi:LamG-like jellyroll fold domain-containing protein [uncultured Polaribacter sp.]|uniref:LamG-like jellyroll fold domain-containing protein n=1 Tax=uncultured Polaribacter sp. TaxID=174711 RepID=UPI00262B2848|nr:LamG-like jellyroll fold domain-containing protein [uncultured Polaribacter sp.]
MKKLLITFFTFALGMQFLNAQTADTSKYLMYFPFDDNVTDASSKNVTLNPKTAGIAINTYETGKFGKAALFNDKPYITANSTFDAGESFSILMWVNFNSLTSSGNGTPKLIHQEDGGTGSLAGRPFQLATPSAAIGVKVNTSFGEIVSNSSDNPVADTWIHVALVMDKTAETIKMYINGVQDVSNTIGDNIKVSNKTNNSQISFGVQKNSTTTGLLDATIDDFLITSEVLDVDDINNIMTNSAAEGGNVLSVENYTENTVDFKLFKSTPTSLKVESAINFNTFKIVNVLGQEVKSGKIENKRISLNSLSKGLHFVKLYSDTDKIRVSKKIIL